MRYSIIALLLLTAIVAGLLAFWLAGPRGGFFDVVPFEHLVLLLAIVLITGAVIAYGAFWR